MTRSLPRLAMEITTTILTSSTTLPVSAVAADSNVNFTTTSSTTPWRVHNDTSAEPGVEAGGMTSLPAMTSETTVSFNVFTVSENSSSCLGEDGVETFLQQKNDEFTQLVLPAIIFLGFLCVIGVSGNLMVLYVYNRKLRKGTIRWFIQALAVFDLLSCSIAIPGEIIDMRNNYTFGSSFMCKVLRTVSMFCTVASGVTLMVVAVERYKRICRPYSKQITSKRAQVIVALCAVTASICAAPASVIYGKQTTPTDNPAINGSDCSTSDAFIGTVMPLAFSSFQFLIFLVGALGLTVFYLLIGRKIWSHARLRRVGFNSSTAAANRRMSFLFTGSDCSSPTTEEMVFAFPNKKNADENNSNSSNGGGNNNDQGDNNNVHPKRDREESSAERSSNGSQRVSLYEEAAKHASVPVYEKPSNDATSDDASAEVEKQPADPCLPNGTPAALASPEKHLTPTNGFPKTFVLSKGRPGATDKPPSPTSDFPKTFDTFRKIKPASRQTSRERHRSGDSTGFKGRYQRRSTQHTQSDIHRFVNRSNSIRSSTRQTTLMLFLITLVYLLSFLPYLVLMIVKVMDKDSLSGRGGGWELAHNFLLRSYFINSMANPIIYSFCSRTFRTECAKVLHCRRCCKWPLFVR